VTRYATGTAVTVSALDEADPDLADALFLHSHPGWTMSDLDALPEHTLSLLRLIGLKANEAANRASR
jgi:hypothetical protein